MEDDDGFESFAVDDEDLDRAMNPGARRHFQSKDQAIYGIWAPRDEESDDDDVVTTRNNKSGPRRPNYKAPVNFVSGGVKIGNKVEPTNKPEAETHEYDAFDNKPPPPKKQTRKAGGNVFAGMRTSATRGAVDPNKFCDWAKFGKGSVVMEMMKKMGYKDGEGLGASGQGIIEPVQAAVRAGRGAVGAYGKEATGPKFGESAADAQKRLATDGEDGGAQEGRQESSKGKGGWKKNASVKIRYKTLDDVMKEGADAGIRPTKSVLKEKVIDMTGREQKVYSGYDSFTNRTREIDENEEEERTCFDIPELRYNINLLLDLTEDSIRKSGAQVRSLKDEATSLQYDLDRLKSEKIREEKENNRLKEVYTLIDKFAQRKGKDSPTLSECQELFLTLRSDFREEYKLFSLDSVAIPCVLPQIKSYFSKWRPLDPDHLIFGVDLMKEWKQILLDTEDRNLFAANKKSFDQLSAYDRVLWEGWIPSIRSAALNWNPKIQVEEMLKLMEVWLPMLPFWMKENVIEQIIIPRMETSVNQWDPTQDDIPIHSWIIPWLDVLGDRIQPLIARVRQVLGEIIQKKWSPEDQSAIAMLLPWLPVWAPGTMASFVARFIVPKLEQCLQQMNLDPRVNIHYTEWKAVVAWLDIICVDTIANLVNRSFFPRFYDILCSWLDSGNANFVEVKQWYTEWCSRIPQQLLAFPTIKENLRRSMIVIAESQRGVRVSSLPRPDMAATQQTQQPSVPAPARATAPQSLSFKEMIEMLANRHDLTYVPQKDRFKDGRQVFWFGHVSIYVDQGLVYVWDLTSSTWRPVSMDELLQLAGVRM